MVGLLDRWSKKKQTERLTENKAKKETKEPVVRPAAEEKVKHTKKVSQHSTAYRILVRPLVTEKAAIKESENKYSFMVSREATKNQVKEAVAEAYGVKPVRINIMNVQGRRVRFGNHFGRRSDFKKAIVTLPVGKSINIHEGV